MDDKLKNIQNSISQINQIQLKKCPKCCNKLNINERLNGFCPYCLTNFNELTCPINYDCVNCDSFCNTREAYNE